MPRLLTTQLTRCPAVILLASMSLRVTKGAMAILVTVATLALSKVASAEEPTINRLMSKVTEQLPEGWTASYDKEHAWLEVRRKEAASTTSALPNQSPCEKPKQESFAFAFRVLATALSREEHRRLSDENAKIRKEASSLYEELVRRRVPHKFDSFQPIADNDKTAVTRYEALKRSLHSLPDFYFDDIGLVWGFNSPDAPIIHVTDDRVLDECTRVQEKIVRLLSKPDVR